MLGLLDDHLARRPYLFGGRPAYGDFGLWGQFYELWTDPTTGALIEGNAPHVLEWIHRMLWPKARRRLRELGGAGADPDADPDKAGRKTVLALDARQ